MSTPTSTQLPVTDLPPWLKEPWHTLTTAVDQDRVAHAMLIRGPQGIGKTNLALAYAHFLLCQKPAQGMACGHCASCHLIAAETHPDLCHLRPEEQGKSIKVDVIRQLIQQITLTPQYGGYRVVVISTADALNANSANALLKSLEEPPEGTIFLLVSDRPQALPLTIRSRCRNLNIPPVSQEVALQWLKARCANAENLLSTASGSPLRALALEGSEIVAQRLERFEELLAVFYGAKDPLDVAAIWSNCIGEMDLMWMASWFSDVIRLEMTEGRSGIRNLDLDTRLRTLSARIPVTFLLESYDRVIACQEAIRGPANRQLVFEEFLIRWAEGAARPV